MEKRFKIRISKKGNVRIETISGFAGTNCNETVDEVMACINGRCVGEGDTEDRHRAPSPEAIVYGVD